MPNRNTTPRASPNLKPADGPRPALLVLDDDEILLQTLVYYLETRGFHVAAASSVSEAKALYQRRKGWRMVISDYHLPDGNGWDFCCWIRQQPGVTPPFLLMSGAYRGEALSGVDYLAKPFVLADLDARVQAALQSGEDDLLRPPPAVVRVV